MNPYSGFPATYSNPYYMQNQAYTSQNPPGQQQMQSGGFIRVQSENQARMYPIQPGTSATFIDENAPYCYTKTLDFSQLDRPIFKKFRLVEETDTSSNAQNAPQTAGQDIGVDLDEYALKADLNVLNERLEALQKAYEDLQRKIETTTRKECASK